MDMIARVIADSAFKRQYIEVYVVGTPAAPIKKWRMLYCWLIQSNRCQDGAHHELNDDQFHRLQRLQRVLGNSTHGLVCNVDAIVSSMDLDLVCKEYAPNGQTYGQMIGFNTGVMGVDIGRTLRLYEIFDQESNR